MPRMLLLLSGLLLLATQSHAALITHAVHARTVLKPCLPNTYPCAPSTIDEDGGAQATSAASSQTDVPGHAAAEGQLGGPTSTPILKAVASAGLGYSSQSTTVAVQRYTYSGADGGSFVLDFNLHGVVTTDPLFGSPSDAGIVFRIGFVRGTSQLDYDPTFGWGTLYWEAGGVAVPGNVQAFMAEGDAPNILGSVSIFDLLDNESFFVVTELVATAENGATADAFNTVTMRFVDDTGLTPSGIVAGGTVSTAPSLLLMLGGLMMVGRLSRRR